MNNLPNSTDGVVTFISDITNKGITLSKGTLINWNNELSNKLTSEVNYIEKELIDSYYLNHDESQFKINGDGYNVLCACNNKYVLAIINMLDYGQVNINLRTLLMK